VWGRVLLLAAIVVLNLACMTLGVSFKVTHQEGQEDLVSITMSRHMTEEYREAARRANTDREADYLAAGRPPPDSGFFDTMEQARTLLLVDQEDLEADGYRITEDDRGFTAVADYTLNEFLEKQTPGSTMRLQVDYERPEGVYYVLEIALPEIDSDIEDLDRLRQEGPGPKPPLEPIEEEQLEEGSITEGLAALLDIAGLGKSQLDLWYAQRILIEAGLPRNEYTVELPGQIIAHEVSGVPTGQVEGNRVTFVYDEAFMRQFGPGQHLFRVESLLSVCQETCDEQLHAIWDGESEYPTCSCICERGWEMTAEGCLDCQSLCQQQDPPTEYDPESSEVNRCACRPLSDRDGDGIPDEQDKCPEEAAETDDGCPKPGVNQPEPEEGEGTTPATSKVETFLAGEGTKSPTAGQAAGAAATLAGMAYLYWLIFRAPAADREFREEAEFLSRQEPVVPPPEPVPPTTLPEKPPRREPSTPPATPPPATPPLEPTAPPATPPPATPSQEPVEPPSTEEESPLRPGPDPQSLELLQTRFQEMVDQRIKEGHFVMNRDGVRKFWNWGVWLATRWFQEYRGGQCGEFAEWGAEWSRDFVREIFGEGAIVDYIHIGERSSRDPEGFIDRLDWLYQANHAATRVILPTGESYILDYWEAVGERQPDPVGDAAHDLVFGGPRRRREIRLVPEKEWIEKWTSRIGEDEAEVFNVSYEQEEFQRCLFICDSFEEACERFMSLPTYARGSDLKAQTIINNWRKSRWYR
jgi:hypothetical protein